MTLTKANESRVNPSTPARAGRREWIGLAVLMLPTLLISMDLTVLHLAVPHLSEALQPTSAQLLWIVDIYGFMIAGSLITMGTLGDRIGRRKLLMIGAAAFGLTSILAAFATSAPMLIAFRALMGIAGATLMPSTMSLIRNMFLDNRQRTSAIGIWVSGFSAGSAIGPLVGGFLLQHFSWGSVFLIGVVVMVILLIAGPLLLPEYKDPNPGRFDLLSAAMSLIAVLTIIFGLKQIAQDGVSVLAIGSIIIGLAAGVLFVQRQRTLTDPLLDLRLFRIPAFSASLAINTSAIFVGFGSFLFIAQYLQLVLGLSPLEAGLWSVPGAIASVVGSNIAPVLVRRVKPAFVIAMGMVFVAIGFGMIAQVGTNSLALVVIGNTILSVGFGFIFTLTSDMIITTAPPERAGAASAISETSNELGGSLGIAILGSIGLALYRGQIAARVPAAIPADVVKSAQETLGGALASAAKLSGDLGTTLATISREAFSHSLQVMSIIGFVVVIGLGILAIVALRNVQPHNEDEIEVEPPPAVRPQREMQVGD